MSATSISDEDDAVVAAALAVLDGDVPEGTENVRRGETDDGAAFVYRVDPDAEGEVDANRVTVDGDSLHADAAMWVANREEVEREAGRRDVEGTGRSTAGETDGNR